MQKLLLESPDTSKSSQGAWGGGGGGGGGERGVGSDALPETGLNERFVR